MEYGQENKTLTNSPTLIMGEDASFVKKTIAKENSILPYGTVLGERADGKLVAVKSDATDGSEIPLFIVFQEQGIDATQGDKEADVLSSGRIRSELLVFTKEDDTLNTVVDKLSMANWLRTKFVLNSVDGFEYLPEA